MSIRDLWAHCALWIRRRLAYRRLNNLYKERDYFLDQVDNGLHGLRFTDRQIALAEANLRHLLRK